MLSFVVLSLIGWTVRGQVTNGVIEQPFVSCAPDAIYAKWKTEQTFTGRVNVRFAPNRYCYQVLVTNNQVELLIPHLDCRISRIRSSKPEGILLEATVLLSFHPEFVTEADRLFVLRCLHTRNGSEMGTGVPQPLTMSTPITTIDEQDNSVEKVALTCSYVVKNDRSGEMIRTVRIGTPVRHEWECEGARPNQCLVVTSCFIKTTDSQHELVDQYGCSKDESLISPLEYQGKTRVLQRSRIFGVADKPFIYYQCEMNLVDIHPNETCPRPKCSGHNRPSRSPFSSFFDAVSQQIEVLPLGVPERWPEEKCPQTLNLSVTEYNEPYPLQQDGHFCMAVPLFFVSGVVLSLLLLVAGSALGLLYTRRYVYHDVAQA
ncbi:unnamed protein product [Bursaphelenchus xylophilus]|uniref:(pine wood nematode) hypothetical protein n=1 Tax=Bursaphelenchus xylophilus TaxID=6326 RepID=A0A1I7RYH4_BURXY|nr:unnamed protein product [Bursaphelenchus xylophilus]CAG9092680.1 unnamed protein product [Bursaphelenchus xylophilus]